MRNLFEKIDIVMKVKMISYVAGISLLLLSACQERSPEEYNAAASEPEFMHRSMKKLTDVIVHDIYSPPVASRIYAYPSIAAYQAMIPSQSNYKSLAGQLDELTPTPLPDTSQAYCYPLAAIKAFLTVGRTLISSEDQITTFETEIFNEYRSLGIPRSVFDRSLAYGEAVAQHVLEWADGDNYKQTRTFPKHPVDEETETWKPTPPAYMDAIEPHWNKIRTFIIDSATQFVPEPPSPFELAQNSTFYDEVMEVYEVGNNLTEEEAEIASFWDCNPYVMNVTGHVMYATKKITPGGHWVGIVAIASRKANSTFMETLEAYTQTTIALADAFISCWDEKYRSNLIRPETVINEHFDPEWTPLLQTPPFPEYTSGHSVISTAAAIALTDLYGDNFSFTDTTEVEYGLPPRSFDSFLDASAEAAVSRLYGGIHYRPAIDNGVSQGRRVGEFIIEHLETRMP